MRKFSLLISTYYGAFLNPGGGEVELLLICKSLREKGIDVDLYSPFSKSITSYDAVLHFGVHGDGLEVVRAAKKANIKVFLWPNLWWDDSQNADVIETANLFFEFAEKIIIKSAAELKNNSQFIDMDSRKVFLLPGSVDKEFFNINLDYAENFKRLYGVEDYVLWVGVIQERKHQLDLIKALANSSIPIVFIGEPIDKQYYRECVNLSGQKNIFIPNFPHASEILLGAFSGCSMYVELTPEPPGLSALEAGAAGKKMLLIEQDWVTEEFMNLVSVVSRPSDYEVVQEIIKKGCMSKGHSKELSRHIKAKHYLPNNIDSLINLLCH